MDKISRDFIDNMIKKINIVQYMEDQYDCDFIINHSSQWANTNCPMPNHDDSSPSFGVNIENNYYYCFGCNVKGDIIKLVQQCEGYSFIEAVQKLANYANLDIEIANIDIKNIIKECQNLIESYNSDNSFKYPGKLSEAGFYSAFTIRTKNYIKKVNFDKNEIDWIDDIYKKVEFFTFNEDYKSIKTIWDGFSKNCKERLDIYEKHKNNI